MTINTKDFNRLQDMISDITTTVNAMENDYGLTRICDENDFREEILELLNDDGLTDRQKEYIRDNSGAIKDDFKAEQVCKMTRLMDRYHLRIFKNVNGHVCVLPKFGYDNTIELFEEIETVFKVRNYTEIEMLEIILDDLLDDEIYSLETLDDSMDEFWDMGDVFDCLNNVNDCIPDIIIAYDTILDLNSNLQRYIKEFTIEYIKEMEREEKRQEMDSLILELEIMEELYEYDIDAFEEIMGI